MDPVSIIGLVGTVVGLITRNLQSLINLQSKYKYSSLVLTLLIGQLTTLKAALDQVTGWVSNSLINIPEYEQLVADIQVALESCHVFISVLEERIDTIQKEYEGGDLATKGKLWFLTIESSLTEFNGHLNNQVNALNLLLTAFQCRTTFERNELLRDGENREMMDLVKDDSTSLLSLRGTDGSSARTSIALATDSFSLISQDFDFDKHILSTNVYRAAWRYNMKNAARTWKGKIPQRASSQMSEHEFEEMTISHQPNNQSTATLPPQLSSTELASKEMQQMIVREARPLLSESDPKAESDRATSFTTEDTTILARKPLSTITEGEVVSHGSMSASEWTNNSDLATVRPRLNERVQAKNFAALKFRIPKILGGTGGQRTPQSLMPHLDEKHQPMEPPPPPEEIKILVLGACESGKSTLLKLMRSALKEEYSKKELEPFQEIVFSNVVQSTREILEAMKELGIPLENQQNEYHVSSIFMQPMQIEDDVFPELASLAIKEFWKDSGFRTAFERSHEYQLSDAAAYFFSHIERIADPEYIPTENDVLMSRVQTTGVTETSFFRNNTNLRVFDVGGTRPERKKWIHCFEKTNIVLFTTDLGSYNQNLSEDKSTNRLQEDLVLFASLVTSGWFTTTKFALLCMKMDKLASKIKKVPLREYFDDYEGGDDLEAATKYLVKKFLSLNKTGKYIRVYYISVEHALETASVQKILDDLIYTQQQFRHFWL